MLENTDQNNSKYGSFLLSDTPELFIRTTKMSYEKNLILLNDTTVFQLKKMSQSAFTFSKSAMETS